MLQTLDVLLVQDDLITPPNVKFWVCIEPAMGWFFRINSKSHWRPCLKIDAADHPFLDHESFIECNLLEVDDSIVERALNWRGVLGRIDHKHCAQMMAIIDASGDIRTADKALIRAAFDACTG